MSKSITYEEILATLESNHFYVAKQTTDGSKGKKITGLHVTVPVLIRANDIKERVIEILAEEKVSVEYMPNEGYLLIQKKK